MSVSSHEYRLEHLVSEMADTNDSIWGMEDLSEILASVVDRVKRLVRADFAAVSTYDERGEVTRFIDSELGDTLSRHESADPEGDDAWLGRPLGTDVRSRVPILTLDQTIGVLHMTRAASAGTFTEAEDAAAQIMALQVATTISTAVMRQTQSRITRLYEREQVVHDLQDGTMQALYALGLEADVRMERSDEAETREALAEVIARVNGVMRDMRAYIEMLEAETRSSPPDLVAELNAVVRQIVTEGVDVVMNINAPAVHEIEFSDVAELVYIAREALSNAVRHGKPTRVAVDLRQTAEATALTIQDNGVGFDPEAVRHSTGTVSVRTRAERLGAELRIVSVPGMGTTVRVLLPRYGT